MQHFAYGYETVCRLQVEKEFDDLSPNGAQVRLEKQGDVG